MVKWHKLFAVFAIFLALIVGGFSVYEMANYMAEYKDFEVYVTLAARASLQQSQDLYLMWDQSESLSDVTNEAARHAVISDTARDKIDALDDAELRGRVLDYCDQIENLARSAGITEYNPALGDPKQNDSDIYYYLQTLRANAAKQNANYNPMQFGLSYVDEEVLQILFQDNLERLITANYTGDENNSGNFMLNRVNFRGAIVTVGLPRVIDLTGSSNEDEWAYEELFGVYRGSSSQAENSLDYGSGLLHDRFSDFVIQFDLQFSGAGWHNMRSVIGGVQDPDDDNQLLAKPNSWGRTYTVQFPGGASQTYWSIGLPWIEYSTRYTFMN